MSMRLGDGGFCSAHDSHDSGVVDHAGVIFTFGFSAKPIFRNG